MLSNGQTSSLSVFSYILFHLKEIWIYIQEVVFITEVGKYREKDQYNKPNNRPSLVSHRCVSRLFKRLLTSYLRHGFMGIV